MKSFIASSLAGLLLVLTPAQPAAAQELTTERLTELCRPQLEALYREEALPFFEEEVDMGREYLAEIGRDAHPDRVNDIRQFEVGLADLRANGLNAAHMRQWIDRVRQYDDAEIRGALDRDLAGFMPYGAAAERCLAEALLAGNAGVLSQNTPVLNPQEGPLGLRDKSPASTGLAPATVGSNYGAQPSGGNGDVFGRCVQIARYPDDGGIQTVWAMNNVCSQSIIVSYCFRAAVQAAGDPNLCSRLEKRTHEIPGNGKIDFPFTLVDEGQSMSDGTLAGENSLTVLGFACTEGRFPNVYFDGGRFLSRGC